MLFGVKPLSLLAHTTVPDRQEPIDLRRLPGVTVLSAEKVWSSLNLAEVWRHRDLLLILAKRDIQVRYKQTALGAAWAILQPLTVMVLLSLVFGKLLGAESLSGSSPYPVFLYAGLLPWMLFAASVTSVSNSLVGNANLLQKVYFPRLLLPLSALGAPVLDYLAALSVLAILMLFYGLTFSWQWCLLPLLVSQLLLAALGVGLFLAALTVVYRDFRYVVAFLLQVWFFLSPVIVPSQAAAPAHRWLWYLNPLSGLIEACRSVVLSSPFDLAGWSCSLAGTAAMLALGLAYFCRTQRRFADMV